MLLKVRISYCLLWKYSQ